MPEDRPYIWLDQPDPEEQIRLPFHKGGDLVFDRASRELYVSIDGHQHRQIWCVRTPLRWPKKWEDDIRYDIGVSITARKRGWRLGFYNCNRPVGRVDFWATAEAIQRLGAE